jgi:multiple sugar transport system substrate-binding protein
MASIARVVFSVFAAGLAVSAAHAGDFDWKKFQGKTLTFLANNNPISQALLTHKADFGRWREVWKRECPARPTH